MAFSSDGTSLAVSWKDGTLARWDTATLSEQWRVDAEIARETIAVSDGKTLLVATDFDLEIRDFETGSLRGAIPVPDGYVKDMAITDDGRMALLGCDDGSLQLMDLLRKKTQWRVKAHGLSASNLHILPHAERGISASIDGALKVWDLKRRYRPVAGAHSGTVFGAALTPDGTRAATVSADHSVVFWDIKTGHSIKAVSAHRQRVLRVCVSDNGALACSASDDGTVGLWDLRDGTLLHRFGEHKDRVFALAMTPDGSRIISGSWDHTVRVWETTGNRALTPLSFHNDGVHEVAISDDGRVALSCDGKPACVVWDVDRGERRRILESSSGVHHRLSCTLGCRVA
jgi:WD40 repeat protein